MLPHGATEMNLSLFFYVFGWVFGSLLTSTLAAWLVDTKATAFERRDMHDTLQRYWSITEFYLCWHMSFRLRWRKEWGLESMLVKTM